ncbi:MAG: ABC transporter substrate-binding protein [Alphaproteobacteria bacterium]
MNRNDNSSQLNWLGARLTQGAISRREFTGRAMALGVSSILASTMAAKALQAAPPKRGGKMTLAMSHGGTSDTLDPALVSNGFEWTAIYGIANTLTEVAPDGKLVPSLAESWESSSDAKSWSFKLRKGVEFHDGRSLTTKDVVANINYHTKEDSKSAVSSILSQIEEMNVDGAHSITFKLKAGNADFPSILSSANTCIFPAISDDDIDWRGFVGTGGYSLKDFEPGVRANFQRNPNYWKEGRAHADQVELLSIVDPNARTSALLSGQVDAIDQVDSKTAKLLEKKPGIQVEEYTGPLHYAYSMFTQTAPYNSNNVRMALKLGIDRDAFLTYILQGRGTKGNDHPIGPSYEYHAADLEQTPFDPDKAKWHLKQEGLESVDVALSTAEAAFAGAVDAAVLYQESCKKSGINLAIERESSDGYWSNVWLKKPFVALYWGGYQVADTMLTTAYDVNAPWNDTQWDHPRFQKLLVEARAELDKGKRGEMYYEMQKILRDEGGIVVPAFANAVTAKTDKVAHGDHVSALKAFDGRRIIERWWVA